MAHESSTKECFVSTGLDEFWRKITRETVCKHLPVEHQYNKKYYCVLHLPNKQKHINTDFETVFIERLRNKNLDFRYVYFPNEIVFENRRFTGTVNFISAIFKEYVRFEKVIFNEDVYFTGAIFNSFASFRKTTFNENAIFSNTSFNRSADFGESTFNQLVSFSDTNFAEWASFSSTVFDETSQIKFESATFEKVASFSDSIFKSYITFHGKSDKLLFDKENSELHMSFCQIEKAKRISFNNVYLKPSWFIHVNSSKFNFTDIKWAYTNGNRKNTEQELNYLKTRKKELLESIYDDSEISNPNILLTIACRQLADNYEENKGFEEASMFRQMASESKRLAEYNGFKIWSLHWWYWLSSFYGESWQRALCVLVGILLIFVFIYMLVAFQVCPMDKPLTLSIQQNLCETRNLSFGEAILHSLGTATFQNIEYQKPITIVGEILRIFEKIFAPIQAALLALAIRRKFMR